MKKTSKYVFIRQVLVVTQLILVIFLLLLKIANELNLL